MWLSRSSGGQQPGQPQHLLDDFAGRQIAHDAIQAAGAKHAAHRAADLRADANRPPRAVAQQHAFDLLAVGKSQQQLFGAVGGLMMLGDRRRPEREIGRQRVRSSFGRLVISSNDSARRSNSHWRICAARYAGSPRSASQAARVSGFGSRSVDQGRSEHRQHGCTRTTTEAMNLSSRSVSIRREVPCAT